MSTAALLESQALPPVTASPVPFGMTEVERIGEAIAGLAARLHAVTYELLVLLREFDARSGWNTGFLSCAHWLHWRTGIDLGAAREKVRVAKALAQLPSISASMQRGRVSYAKVRALTRIATPQNEAALLNLALAGTAVHVERVVRGWRQVDRAVETRRTESKHLHRMLTTYVDDDGMVVLRARLTPEAGALVQRAIQAASDQLFRDGRDCARPVALGEEVNGRQRSADALVLLAEAALAANLDRGTNADRYQVVLHVDAEAPGGTVEMNDGPLRVSAETSRRLACDASIVVMQHARDGAVLDVGRRSRTVPAAIRRALSVRDPHCRFPGCSSRHGDAHHVVHWADGGNTRLDNLLLLCRRHHRAVHEGRILVTQADGALEFSQPDGRPLPDGPELEPGHSRAGSGEQDAVEELPPTWQGEPFDLDWILNAVYRPAGQEEPSNHEPATITE